MTNIKLQDKARRSAETFKMVILLGAIGIFMSAILLVLVATQQMEVFMANSLLVISFLNLGFAIGMITVGVSRLYAVRLIKVPAKELEIMKKAAQYMLETNTNVLYLDEEKSEEATKGHKDFLQEIKDSLPDKTGNLPSVSLFVYEGDRLSKSVNVSISSQGDCVVMA